MSSGHVLVATFPAQGHINPALQFAKRLVNAGIKVTFFTSVYAWRRMEKNIRKGPISFLAFSDGYDDGQKPGDDGKNYMSEMKRRGAKALAAALLEQGRHSNPVTYVVYSHLFAWAAGVARGAQIPSALLWIEPAAVLVIYYHYFNGYREEIDGAASSDGLIQLPGLPLTLSKHDLPSFLLPSTPERFRLLMKEKLETLDQADEAKPKVLVNTFDTLEPDALKAIERYELVGIGPLLPPALLLDGGDPSDVSFGGDLFERSDDSYLEWLSSKAEGSVVYVSFGSFVKFPKSQMEEIARGLLDCGRPFLWVIRGAGEGEEQEEDDDQKLSCLEELGRLGKIVGWCSQLEVLRHPSVGCFVTHCGWNSALESIALGVPVVAYPQWFDQGTNATLMQDMWKTGVRVTVKKCEDDEGSSSIVDRNEIRRCIEEVMDGGPKSQQLRESSKKWMNLARQAMEEGGSSMNNLKAFLEQVGG